MNEANILKYTDEANGQNTVDKFSWVGAPIFTKKDSERRPIERESIHFPLDERQPSPCMKTHGKPRVHFIAKSKEVCVRNTSLGMVARSNGVYSCSSFCILSLLWPVMCWSHITLYQLWWWWAMMAPLIVSNTLLLRTFIFPSIGKAFWTLSSVAVPSCSASKK